MTEPLFGRSIRAMGSLVQRNKVVAKRKGAVATVATGATIAAAIAGAPVLAVIGLAGSAYLAWDWFIPGQERHAVLTAAAHP